MLTYHLLKPQKMKRKSKIPKTRSFVGIAFPLYEYFRPLIADLEKLATEPHHKLRIAPPENLHITVKFIGTVEQDQIRQLDSILCNKSAKQHPVLLQCHGIGFFKNSLWISIKQNDYLKQLVTEIDDAFTFLGISKESKDFVPHITLARFDSSLRQSAFGLQQKYADKDWGEFKVDRYQLFKSETLAKGARYTVLNEYLL